MQLFNVGALELIFILLIAFIVLGPKKAVKAAADVGNWIRKLVSSDFWRELSAMSSEIQELPKRMMDEAEIQKTIDEIERSTKDVNQTLKETRSGFQGDVVDIENEIRSPHHIHPDPVEEQDE